MASNLATLISSRKCDIKHIPEPVIVYPGTEVSIGRSPKADLSFPDVKQISHVHCYVRNHAGTVELKSVSSNKTSVSGKPIAKEEWIRIRDGDSVCLSQEPLVKFEVRIGSEVNVKGKRKSSSKRSGTVIAEITSPTRPGFEYLVVPSSKHASELSVTIGRSKDCDVFIDNKKISSTHCKLVFSKVGGESVHWNMLIECVSRNKTYIGTVLIEEAKLIEHISEPVNICFVFPQGEKPVETFTITPVIEESGSFEPVTASEMIKQELDKEQKRQRKELHHLEKRSKEWESQYRQGIEKLQDAEHELQIEIERMERSVKGKRSEIDALKEKVATEESHIKQKEETVNTQKESLRLEHNGKMMAATAELNGTIAKLQKLSDEKLQLQMGSSTNSPSKVVN